MTVSFQATPAEEALIVKIAKRAAKCLHLTQFQVLMDIAACHANGVPLDLEAFAEADMLNFTHDVMGIRTHLDRKTGTLTDSFLPRFAKLEKQPTSWAPEVIADSSGKWAGNALRFATREEALANVADLRRRWILVRETRVVPSDDPVNYRWTDGGLVAVEL